MCTLLLLRRPGAVFPLLLAANRDEKLDRPWDPPGAHWPDQPDAMGGRDRLAGGTWLALGGAGVVAGVLNRTGSLGPEAGKRSRGELPLLAVRHRSAAEAASALGWLEAPSYRSFNLVVADCRDAFLVASRGEGPVEVRPLGDGFTMVTSGEPNDGADPRISRHLPRFEAAPPPVPPEWGAWPGLLADRTPPLPAALEIPPTAGFGTSSSSLMALAPGRAGWWFAPGPPSTTPFEPLDLGCTGLAPLL